MYGTLAPEGRPQLVPGKLAATQLHSPNLSTSCLITCLGLEDGGSSCCTERRGKMPIGEIRVRSEVYWRDVMMLFSNL